MKRSFINKIYLNSTIKRLEAKEKKLGSKALKVETFLNIRLALVISIFIIILFTCKYGAILAPVIALIFYIIFEYFVYDYNIKKRGKKLEKEAIFFFEVLVLTLEGGRSLKHALDLTTQNIDSEISLEFKTMLHEVKLGKSINEALEALKKRIPSEAINNAILNMVQANIYGTNIVDSLYNQIDYLRQKQILDVKAEIAKLPTKISVISVLFFIPIILLIILAPILLNYIMN